MFLDLSTCPYKHRRYQKIVKMIMICYNIGGGGAVQPHFSPRHTEIWIWGWAKMGKKYMEREGNKLSILNIEKIPIFPMMRRNLDLGMGKNGEKSIWKDREKVFVLTNCCTLLSVFSTF